MSGRLDQYFDESAARFFEGPALHIGERFWSYGELAASKRAIASALCARGLGGAGRTAGVLAAKSAAAYAGLLGIMESGNIYVPLNTKLPPARLARQIEAAELAAMIVDRASIARAVELLAAAPLVVVLPELESLPEELEAFAGKHSFVLAGDLERELRAAGAPSAGPPSTSSARARSPSTGATDARGAFAYLLFTSGSTGAPKGVGVTHANARALVDAAAGAIPTTHEDRFTQLTELSFDVSIGELFLCWRGGGCLYVPTFAETMMPLAFVNRHELTVWSSVPTLANNLKALGVLGPGVFPKLRLSLFCGEALPTRLAAAWQSAAPASRVINLYGPTEATVFATSYSYSSSSPPKSATVPIGRPLESVDYRISEGELLLGGPQVVPGYWRDPAATARAFVELDGRSWYRTGDLVSHNEDGDLLFHGRSNDELKLRGYRINLREIEEVLRRATEADLVAVVPIYNDDQLCEELVAYCSELHADRRELERRCRELLPEYMVPKRIIALDRFPLNASGKIDHRELAARAAAELEEGR